MHPNIEAVRSAVECYSHDQFVYWHRAVAIARAIRWDCSDDYVQVEFELVRLVTSEQWTAGDRWSFGTRCEYVGPARPIRCLRAGMMRDTVFIDQGVFERANTLHPHSPTEELSAFERQLTFILYPEMLNASDSAGPAGN